MKLLRKQHYIYTITSKGKEYTVVTTRNIIQQKYMFELVHEVKIKYEDIEVKKIPQSRYDSSYLTHIFI